MTADDVRARFEAWATERGLLIRRAAMICGRAAGPYDRDEVQSAWNAYRAAHADLSGEVRELVEALQGLRQAHLKQTGRYPLPQCDDYAAMRAADAALAKFTQEKP